MQFPTTAKCPSRGAIEFRLTAGQAVAYDQKQDKCNILSEVTAVCVGRVVRDFTRSLF
jgi:hypothetical protein